MKGLPKGNQGHPVVKAYKWMRYLKNTKSTNTQVQAIRDVVEKWIASYEELVKDFEDRGLERSEWNEGCLDVLQRFLKIIDSLPDEPDNALTSYIKKRKEELDAIIAEEMTRENIHTLTYTDKVAAVGAKNELLRIEEMFSIPDELTSSEKCEEILSRRLEEMAQRGLDNAHTIDFTEQAENSMKILAKRDAFKCKEVDLENV